MRTDWTRFILPAAAVLVFGLFASCSGRNDSAAGSAPGVEGEETDSETIMAFGTVVATASREIHLPWTGQIVEIPVWEGQRVSNGDVLAVLDAGDLTAAIDDVRLAVETAQGEYQESVSKLAALDVQLAEAADRLDRNLGSSGAVSQQELSSLQADYDALVHNRNAAEWVLKNCRNGVERAESSYHRLVERSHAAYMDANTIICPFDSAVITEIALSTGTEAESGDLAMVLHDEGSLMVEADLSEEFIRDVDPGDSADVIPIADPERSYSGTVVELAGLARLVNGENTVKIRIRLDEQDGFLREGFNVDVEIDPGT